MAVADELEQRCKPGPPVADLHNDVAASIWPGAAVASTARSLESSELRWLSLSYRSVRGSPKCGKTLLSANQVIAEICTPSSVRTSSPYGRAIAVWGTGR